MRTDTPWPASDVSSPPREAGLRKMLCQELSKEGFGRSSSSAPDSTRSLSGIPMAHDRSVSMRWTTPRRRSGNASAWLKLNSHFRPAYFRASRLRAGRFGRNTRRRRLSAELARVFHLARRCAISDTGSDHQHSGLHGVNPELGGGIRLHGSPQAFSEEMKELVTKRTEQLEKIGERWASHFEPAGMAAILRGTDFVRSKTSISRRSGPGSATPFMGSPRRGWPSCGPR